MFSVVPMSGKLYAMKSVDSFEELRFDENELERAETFVNQGQPIIFCEDLEDLKAVFKCSLDEIEIVEAD